MHLESTAYLSVLFASFRWMSQRQNEGPYFYAVVV